MAKEQKKSYGDMPEQMHCQKCRTLMENGKCPACGHTVYIPMSKSKQDKIKLALAVVFMAAFVVLFVLLQIKKGS